MKEAPGSRCWQVIALRSLLLFIAVPILSLPGWGWSGSAAHDATPSPGFVPPDLSYSSVFKNYHGYREEAVASWQEANDTVGRIGGWRAYLEEAAQPSQPVFSLPPQPASASSKDPDNHSGHGGVP